MKTIKSLTLNLNDHIEFHALEILLGRTNSQHSIIPSHSTIIPSLRNFYAAVITYFSSKKVPIKLLPEFQKLLTIADKDLKEMISEDNNFSVFVFTIIYANNFYIHDWPKIVQQDNSKNTFDFIMAVLNDILARLDMLESKNPEQDDMKLLPDIILASLLYFAGYSVFVRTDYLKPLYPLLDDAVAREIRSHNGVMNKMFISWVGDMFENQNKSQKGGSHKKKQSKKSHNRKNRKSR